MFDCQSLVQPLDVVFIMAYDERNDVIPGPCTAWANSPINKTRLGIAAVSTPSCCIIDVVTCFPPSIARIIASNVDRAVSIV